MSGKVTALWPVTTDVTAWLRTMVSEYRALLRDPKPPVMGYAPAVLEQHDRLVRRLALVLGEPMVPADTVGDELALYASREERARAILRPWLARLGDEFDPMNHADDYSPAVQNMMGGQHSLDWEDYERAMTQAYDLVRSPEALVAQLRAANDAR